MNSLSWSRIEFEVSVCAEDFEPSDYITTWEGKIIDCLPDNNDDDCEEDVDNVGTIRVHIVELGRAMDEGQSFFEIMDSHNADTRDCFEQLFDADTGQWKSSVEQFLSEDRMVHSNLMLFDRLEIESKIRGQRIGKQVALRIIQKLGDTCELIACKPFPLQFAGTTTKKPQRGLRAAQKQVREFWQDVGFVRVPGSDYYVWPD